MSDVFIIKLRGAEQGRATFPEIQQRFADGELTIFHKFQAPSGKLLDYDDLCASLGVASNPATQPGMTTPQAPPQVVPAQVINQTEPLAPGQVSPQQPGQQATHPQQPVDQVPGAQPPTETPDAGGKRLPKKQLFYIDDGESRVGPMKRSKVVKFIERDQVEPHWRVELEGGYLHQTLQDAFPNEIAAMLHRRAEKVRIAEEEERRKQERIRQKEEARIAAQQQREAAEIQRQQEYLAQQAYFDQQRKKPAVFECFALAVLCGFGVMSAMAIVLSLHELSLAKTRPDGKRKPLVIALLIGIVGFLFNAACWVYAGEILTVAPAFGVGAAAIASFIVYKRKPESRLKEILNNLFMAASFLGMIAAVVFLAIKMIDVVNSGDFLPIIDIF